MFRIPSASSISPYIHGCSILSHRSPYRYLSTNSAIHRGLRKSRRGQAGPRSNVRVGTFKNNELPGKRIAIASRAPRPNHLQRQDAEDMAESARLKERKGLQNRRPAAKSGHGNISQGSLLHKNTISSRIGQDSVRTQDKKSSSGLNRAARRAIAFGHNERSTESPNLRGRIVSQGLRPPPRRETEASFPSRVEIQAVSEESDGRHHSRGYDFLERKENSRSNYRPTEKARAFPSRQSTIGRSFNDKSSSFGRGQIIEQERGADVPITVPYTTPASEFLYGTTVVTAALRFSQRKFYKLYSYSSPNRVNIGQDQAIRNLARSKGVDVKQVDGAWLRILDKMSTGRPHNVCYIVTIGFDFAGLAY